MENLKRVTIHGDAVALLQRCHFHTCHENDHYQEDYYHRSVERIQNRDWFSVPDKNTGRLFNNVTNLPRLLRPFLRLDGKPLVEIDVANCQPLLLISFYEGEPERERFKEAVESGQFYEMLNAGLEKPYGADKRDKLKEKVYSQIFFDRKRENPSKLCKAFGGLFPVLYGKIEAIKHTDYRKVALRLQSAEAGIMLGRVVRHIAETSQIPVLTIHDSILCFEEHKDYVKQLMENAFAETLGVRPKLKFKDNRPDTSEVVKVPPPKSRRELKRKNTGKPLLRGETSAGTSQSRV